MINIGLIGTGIVGVGHLEGAAKAAGCRIAALADVRQERAQELGRQFGVPRVYGRYQDLLNAGGLDAVVVATHLDTHCEITLEALGRGLHVLCEKPMGRNVEECQAMCEAARRANRLLAVNFNTRSSTEFTSIKRLLDTQDAGKVRVVRCLYVWSAHHWQPIERMNAFMAEGGPIVDSGVHFFDAIRWFSGQEIVDIQAAGAVIEPYEHPQHVAAVCRLSGGGMGLVEVGWLYTKNVKDEGYMYNISVIADGATVDYESVTGHMRLWGKDKTVVEHAGESEKHFEVVHGLFAQSIQAGRLIGLASGEDGLAATRASFEALRATKSGQRV